MSSNYSSFSRLEKLADLASKPNGIEVAVKFINRTSRPAYLETINNEGDRELQHTLNPGGSRTVITEEKTYWIATMNRDTDEGLLLNYGWYYSPVRTRMKKERCYITDCKYYICEQVCFYVVFQFEYLKLKRTLTKKKARLSVNSICSY